MWPLDTPCVITGNYGELRPNHFHAGIDFSTGGRINRKVYAVADGYVSRIRVNAGAYGRCVYVTHPGNRVTVYAHLNSFNLAIAGVVEKEQRQKTSFEVELLPAPGSIPVKRGEVLGLSGNTGSSSGPHLHFEIRDEMSETPLNPLETYRLPDTVRPVLESLGFYDLSDSLVPVLTRVAKIHPATVAQSFVVPVKVLGISFMGHDRITSRGGKNNVYGAEVFFDGQLIYSHTLRAIDFADNRYVNEFSETSGRAVLQRCFLPTLYPPRLYNHHTGKGTISFKDTLSHTIRIVLRDEAGNRSDREFRIRSSGGNEMKPQSVGGFMYVDCTRDFLVSEEGLRLYIPAKTFYRSASLVVTNQLETTSRVSIAPAVNMRSPLVLSFRIPRNYSGVPGKLVLRSQAGAVTGVPRADSVYFYLKNTGQFTLLADISPPEIRTALSAKTIKKTHKFTSFSFRITDRLSGISKYNVFVNGVWVLAEFDAKSDMLTYKFDQSTPKGPLQFVVEVEDRCGNNKKFSYRLIR